MVMKPSDAIAQRVIDRWLRTGRPPGVPLLLFNLREPINALSHGAGMILAFPVTWVLWRRYHELTPKQEITTTRKHVLQFGIAEIEPTTCLVLESSRQRPSAMPNESATFHGVRLGEEAYCRLQRLDHVGIYLLIAGTYTPVAWALMRGAWTWGTLTTVWAIALTCAFRVWHGGLIPTWVSTPMYLTMGWGALFCYFQTGQKAFSLNAVAAAAGRILLQPRGDSSPHAVAPSCFRGFESS